MCKLTCEFLFGARVWLIWNSRKWVAYFIGIFAIAGTAVQVWSVAHNEALHLLPGLRGCISVGRGRRDQWAFWIPLLLYDTTATIFMLVPLLAQWHNTTPTRLLSIFMRDGVLYFIVFACNLVNAVYFSVPGVLVPALNAPHAVTFTAMMASRIVLHIRCASCGSNSGDNDVGNTGGSYGCNNAVPKVKSPRKAEIGEQPGGTRRSWG
ncbi:hypothetical protein BT69DRAFT_1277302 [Atractiella rhizophila]|nr:hypothetical protein BT69DRAFT_1277302 [Atractiella rhizophila]